MEGPWKHNPWYTLLRPYVDACTRFSYRHARVEGKENIPEDAAVIIAPNHCNTLMDALVVLRAHKGPTVFGARADIFDNKTVASILRFLQGDQLVPLQFAPAVGAKRVRTLPKDVPGYAIDAYVEKTAHQQAV